MATGNYKRNKKLKKLMDHHAYLNKKVDELTEDRKKIGVMKVKHC